MGGAQLMNTTLVPLVSGMLVAGYAVVCVFFLRFYRETRDRLFVFFAMAFAILGVQRLGLTFTVTGSHYADWLYLLRLLAFLLILYAIVDKNRR
jgi:hypothetical protein